MCSLVKTGDVVARLTGKPLQNPSENAALSVESARLTLQNAGQHDNSIAAEPQRMIRLSDGRDDRLGDAVTRAEFAKMFGGKR